MQRIDEHRPGVPGTQGDASMVELPVSPANAFRLFFENTPIGNSIVGLDGRFLRVNATLASMLGYTTEELERRSFLDVTHPDEVTMSRERLGRVLAGHQDRLELEKRYLHRDGHTLWAQVTIQLERDRHGQPSVFLVHTEDITQRKEAEEKARALEDRLLRQRNALASLTGIQWTSGEAFVEALKRITETSSRTLGVGRVSIWRFNEGRSAISCIDLYEADTDRHLAGSELSAVEFPGYFRAVEQTDILAAEDAQNDPRTAEFTETYLRPLGIGAMMDACIRVRGVPYGVLCHEHVGPPRGWTGDERTFAAATTNLVALVVEEWENRQAQRALQESDARYRLLFDSNPYPMLLVDGETHRFLAANGAALSLYGYTREQFLGMSIADIRPADEIDAVRASLQHQRPGIRLHSGHHIRRDGSRFDVEVRSHDVLLDARRVFFAMISDVSEQKRTEEALGASERRARTLFDTVRLIVLHLDANANVEYVNPFFLELTGFSAEEVVGRNWIETCLPASDRPALHEAFVAVLERDEHRHYRNAIVTRNGQQRMIAWNNTVLRDPQGRPIGTLSIGEDITEQTRLEQQLRQAQKMEAVGRLAGGVAHDFNNLLTVIMGEVELTVMDGQLPSPISDSLREIKKAADRAASLTRQLLAFSRRQLIQPVVFDLNELVGDMDKMFRRLIGEDIKLHGEVAGPACLVRADRGAMEQVLANLVVNARDAMPDGGELTLAVDNITLDESYAALQVDVAPGAYVRLSVSDTGTGMTDEVKARIFEPFFTTKERGKGTGLGLATSFGIVQQSGGHITVYSEPGIGSTFRVYLPAVPAGERTAAAAASTDAPRGTETILLVEDEAPVRRIAARILTGQGYRVLEAGDAGEALTLLRSTGEQVSLLVTDVVLPGPGGRELADQIHGVRPDIKVIYTSGYTDDVILKHRLVEQGITLIQKPFTRVVLARTVRDVLDRKAGTG